MKLDELIKQYSYELAVNDIHNKEVNKMTSMILGKAIAKNLAKILGFAIVSIGVSSVENKMLASIVKDIREDAVKEAMKK